MNRETCLHMLARMSSASILSDHIFLGPNCALVERYTSMFSSLFSRSSSSARPASWTLLRFGSERRRKNLHKTFSRSFHQCLGIVDIKIQEITKDKTNNEAHYQVVDKVHLPLAGSFESSSLYTVLTYSSNNFGHIFCNRTKWPISGLRWLC